MQNHNLGWGRSNDTDRQTDCKEESVAQEITSKLMEFK